MNTPDHDHDRDEWIARFIVYCERRNIRAPFETLRQSACRIVSQGRRSSISPLYGVQVLQAEIADGYILPPRDTDEVVPFVP